MTIAMPTENEFRKFAPRAREEYVRAFMAGEQYLREAGVLDSSLTLTHWLAQTAAETAGYTILRENMTYTTVARIRAVWPARMRKHSDEWIARNLVKKPIQLSALVYNGRMGNRKGTADGYSFRGGGWAQTTGRYAVEKYAKALGIPMSDTLLDDCDVTLRFACFEWKDGKCSKLAEANDLLGISKTINTGSAKSGIMPNGMPDRKAWYAKAWKVWGDARPLPEVADITASTLQKAGSRTLADATTLKTLGASAGAASATAGAVKEFLGATTTPASDSPLNLVSAPSGQQTRSLLDTMREWTDYSSVFNSLLGALKGSIELVVSNVWIFGLALGCVAFLAGRRIIQWRVEDARLGHNTARLDVGVPEPAGGPARPG
jgi:putative chitinase